MIRCRKSLSAAVAVAALLLAAPAARAAGCSAPQLEGTWVVEVTVADPPPGFPASFTALETYSPGCGLVTSNDIAPLRALGQGAWAQEGGRRYAAAIVFATFGPDNEPAGSIVVAHRLRVRGADAYAGEGEAELLAPSGDSLGVVHFTSSGRRLSLE